METIKIKKTIILINTILVVLLLFNSCSKFDEDIAYNANDSAKTRSIKKDIKTRNVKSKASLETVNPVVANEADKIDVDVLANQNNEEHEQEKKDALAHYIQSLVPQNLDIKNSNSKTGSLIISWTPSSAHTKERERNDKMSGNYSQKNYQIFRKVNGNVNKPTHIHTLTKTLDEFNAGKLQYEDKFFDDFNVKKLPIRKYEYTVVYNTGYNNMRVSDHSKPVSGYVLPPSPVIALQDILKNIEWLIKDDKEKGFFAPFDGHNEKNQANATFSRSKTNSTYTTYTFNNFSPYDTISISGTLTAAENLGASPKTNIVTGALTITGIYQATVKFNNTKFVAEAIPQAHVKAGAAYSGDIEIIYGDDAKKINAICSIFAFLFKTNSEVSSTARKCS